MSIFSRWMKPTVIFETMPAPFPKVTEPKETDPRRPCYVRGQKAIFHRWVNSAHPVLPHGVEPSDNARYFQFRRTEALVEFEDGIVQRVYPSLVIFADNDFDRFEWRVLEDIDTAAEYGMY